MKILVTGANGLVGKELTATMRPEFEVVGTTHVELDVTSRDSIQSVLEKHQPEAIVNCAVVINMDLCEENPKLCFSVNRDGVENILETIKTVGKPMQFVQISSSEAFGRVEEGQYKVNGYTEDDELMPVVNYQRSKAEAEKIVTDFAYANPTVIPRFYILRAAWLFGRGRKTFVENFVESLQKPEELVAIEDQWRSPTWTKYFVESLYTLLEKKYPSGIYHGAAEVKPGEATTPDVLQEISKFLGPEKVKAKIKKIGREGFFKIPRSPSNVLLNTKMPKLPYWREQLAEYLALNFPKTKA